MVVDGEEHVELEEVQHLAEQRRPWVAGQRRQPALGQQRGVLQQRVHEAARGQLAEEVGKELQEALAVQQLAAVGARAGRLRGVCRRIVGRVWSMKEYKGK